MQIDLKHLSRFRLRMFVARFGKHGLLARAVCRAAFLCSVLDCVQILSAIVALKASTSLAVAQSAVEQNNCSPTEGRALSAHL